MDREYNCKTFHTCEKKKMITIEKLYSMRYDLERELDAKGFCVIVEHSQEYKMDIVRITYVRGHNLIITLDIFAHDQYEYDSRGDKQMEVSKFLDLIERELND